MGFFADIVADSRYAIRRPGRALPAVGADSPELHRPEQSQRPNQSRSGSGPDVSAVQEVGLEAPSVRREEVNVLSPTPRLTDVPEVVTPSGSSPSQPIRTIASPISNPIQATAAASRIQRKPEAGKAAQSAVTVTRTAGKSRTESVVAPVIPATGGRPVRAESVHRQDTPKPLPSGRPAAGQPSLLVHAAPSSAESADTHDVQEKTGVVMASPVVSVADAPRSRQHPAEEQAFSVPVIAGAVEQVPLPARPITPMVAEQPHSGLASRAAPSQVRIGQVNVIVEVPAKPARAPTPASTDNDLASRTFLRSL